MSRMILSSVVLRSRDLEMTRSFYERLLGAEFQEEQHDHGPKHYSCNLSGVLLELYPRLSDDKGTDQIGFTVTSLDEVVGRVEPQYIRQGPFDTSYGRGLLLRDPDGRLIHLDEKRN